MKRTEKILRLVAVGFSATELSRSSNDLLDSTYESAKALMAAKQAEVQRVMQRENNHSARKKNQIAQRQREQSVESDWLRKWKPLPPIRTVGASAMEIERSIAGLQQQYEASKKLFRESGHRRHADAANEAKRAMLHMQGQLSYIAPREGG